MEYLIALVFRNGNGYCGMAWDMLEMKKIAARRYGKLPIMKSGAALALLCEQPCFEGMNKYCIVLCNVL